VLVVALATTVADASVRTSTGSARAASRSGLFGGTLPARGATSINLFYNYQLIIFINFSFHLYLIYI
jgi:hypothetical protein